LVVEAVELIPLAAELLTWVPVPPKPLLAVEVDELGWVVILLVVLVLLVALGT